MSTSEMEENGEQISSLQSGIVTEFDSEMDYDTKCVLDVAFENFSGLDFYLLMKRYYLLGGEIRNQDMSELVGTLEAYIKARMSAYIG